MSLRWAMTCPFMLALSGCALAPDRISLESEHVSHVSQHFGPEPTNYGFESLGVAAHWQAGRVSLDVSEGAVLGYCQPRYCSALYGPREVFGARIDYAIWRR